MIIFILVGLTVLICFIERFWTCYIIEIKIPSLTLGKELFEKHEEYSITKQVSNFLSIAHSNASSS